MKKIIGIGVVAFVVLAILAMAVPANAQAIRWGYIPQTPGGWYYLIRGDQVGMLTADNLGMVRRLTNELPRSLESDLRWNGSAYGLPTNQVWHSMYDHDRRPLSGRQRIERGAGVVAVADGVRRIINNPRGAAGWIEAAVGGVLVNDSRYRGQPKNQRRDNGRPQQEEGYANPDVVVHNTKISPADSYQPVSSPVPIWQENGWIIRNHTGFKVELWDGERFAVLLQPGESISLSNPDGIRGVMLIPGNSGRIVQKEAIIKASHDFDGWDLLAPPVPEERK